MIQETMYYEAVFRDGRTTDIPVRKGVQVREGPQAPEVQCGHGMFASLLYRLLSVISNRNL